MPDLKYYEVSRPEHATAGTTRMRLSAADAKRLRDQGAEVTEVGAPAGKKRAAAPANKAAAAPANKAAPASAGSTVPANDASK